MWGSMARSSRCMTGNNGSKTTPSRLRQGGCIESGGKSSTPMARSPNRHRRRATEEARTVSSIGRAEVLAVWVL